KGQFIGLLDDTLCAAGESMEEVLKSTLGKADAAKCDMVSLYYGSEVGADLANNIKSMLCACYPGVEFELVKGDQPHYHFVCSLE
ncbi:MAG: DAK2 domain-containing protein, partial [Chloroflexi bacterium]|nr:DAK2 domain-containing protein [Chloroflexota bacterium]